MLPTRTAACTCATFAPTVKLYCVCCVYKEKASLVRLRLRQRLERGPQARGWPLGAREYAKS
eukprot:7787043-Pyramimonas_sp.AAC.1